jgi:hypothetical protein
MAELALLLGSDYTEAVAKLIHFSAQRKHILRDTLGA